MTPPHPNSSENIGWRLLVFVGVFTPLQTIFVALRFYARSLVRSPWAWDDGLIVTALLGQFVAAGIAIGSVKQSAVGYHVWYLEETNPEAVTIFFKYLVAISSWYYATIWLSKIAILLLYRRLFPQQSVHIIIYVTAAVLLATSIASLTTDLAACRPFSAQWAAPAVQKVHCLDKEAIFIWSTLPNIVTDLVMLILPLPIVWKLHTSTHMKGALTVTFVIGSSGLVASILRFWAFSNTNSFIDATYNAVELIIWTVVEPGIYLLSACMLMYRPLLEKVGVGRFRIGSKDRSKPYAGEWPAPHGEQQPSAASLRKSGSGQHRTQEKQSQRVRAADGRRGRDSSRGVTAKYWSVPVGR
ncbi:uncharacterized protein PG998_011541 [Apiospora kogelbergensis]|uniref:uncharacterized protein n=1 Tax=Apiospora kogelbergensis TaxID=1337665 RepID=UPI003130258B